MPNPCINCPERPHCQAHPALERLIYTKPTFLRPTHPAAYAGTHLAEPIYAALQRITAAWNTSHQDLSETDSSLSLAALFDLLLSGLYANRLVQPEADGFRAGFVHGDQLTFPYIWMCPNCVAEGRSPADGYLPDSDLRGNKRYVPVWFKNRPSGRKIGDFGALAMRVIIESWILGDIHTTSGGGHRGEFDLIISTAEWLILGEIKASPLICFPLTMRKPPEMQNHTWARNVQWSPDDDVSLFIGASPTEESHINLGRRVAGDELWPLYQIEQAVADPAIAGSILAAWMRHLEGYRQFNAEPPATRWHRFGCGNIETGTAGARVQFRVDNTKGLPGIDRTDDIKKGIAQVMLFGRLKRGCSVDAVKTVLFGNLFAETHHEHYLRPLADLQLTWSGERSVYLFDAIVALSRNIINDDRLINFFRLPNAPYDQSGVDIAELVEGIEEFDEV